MTPEQRAERIRRGVAGAPPVSAETLALLRQLFPPPPMPGVRTAATTRLELAA